MQPIIHNKNQALTRYILERGIVLGVILQSILLHEGQQEFPSVYRLLLSSIQHLVEFGIEATRLLSMSQFQCREQDEIFLEASLQGKIENPQILVAGKVFSDQEDQPIQDIKQLLEF